MKKLCETELEQALKLEGSEVMILNSKMCNLETLAVYF